MNKHFGIAELKALNEWRDEILIEASTFLLIAGFIMGTVDIFVGGGIATTLWFKVLWAIIQALAIDGLFFAVWGKVAKAQWTRANLQRNIPLVAVGLVLALVAALVNDILTYQQINGIANSIDAIKQLGIDAQTFTHTRAILVVGVGVLVQIFCRADGTVGHLDSGTPGQPISGTVGTAANGTPVQVGQLGHLDSGTPKTGQQRDTGPLVKVGQVDSGTVDTVRDILKDCPTISIRNLAKQLGVPKTTAANWRLKALEPVEVQP